jgi:hypothetical protein
MKTVIAAACLVALAGIMLLMVIGPRAEAEGEKVVALSDLPQAASPPDSGRAEVYRELYDLRMARIADLEKYAAVGAFPVNHTAVEFTPVFVDGYGVACAVGHLMRCSGATALVDKIAAENNLIKLHEVTEGPAVEWMLRSGLTREECELIQPEYHGWGGDDDEYPREPRLHERATAATAILFIRSHLEGVARKLRKDTPVSLEVALQRLGGDFEVMENATAMTRVFRNDQSAPMLARVSAMDDSGKLISIGPWHEVTAGTSFSVGEGARRFLLETQSAPRP